jgi:hypothetical protein
MMSKVQGLTVFLAALCVSALALDSAVAQDSAPAPQSETATSPDAQDSSQPGWLLRGRNQNRIVNPFRTTPAPGGVRGLQSNKQADTRLGPNVPSVSSPPAVAPAEAAPADGAACLIGFWRRGGQCVPVAIPEHATLDLTGHNWMCERGFRRDRQGCVAIPVPANASLAPRGNSWVCNYGFRRNANSCVTVVVPEYASLDEAGHAWTCNQGYTQRGQACLDDATARLQAEADKAVAARRPGVARAPAAGTGVTINSGETRNGRSSKAKVVIGRF